MDAGFLLVIVVVAVAAVGLLALLAYWNLPGRPFQIEFDRQHRARAIHAAQNSDAAELAYSLGFREFAPTIFMTGGAGQMTPEDIALVSQIIEEGIARFAQDKGAVVVDGGTDAGIMQMIAEARLKHGYTFPLVGVAPAGRISYPGHENSAGDARLQRGHSHFILVAGDQWGDESETIVRITHVLSGAGRKPAFGILINGGQIARQDVFLATTQDLNLPIIVLEGSGRFADELATAKRTGRADQSMLRAIVERGDIQLVATTDGPEGLRDRMATFFLGWQRGK